MGNKPKYIQDSDCFKEIHRKADIALRKAWNRMMDKAILKALGIKNGQ